MKHRKAYVWGLYGSLAVMLMMLGCAVTAHNPHGFYTLLRWVCCAGFAYSAGLLGQSVWTAIFGIQAVLFNPLFQFHFHRDIWQTLDKLAIASVAVAAVMFWKERKIEGDL